MLSCSSILITYSPCQSQPITESKLREAARQIEIGKLWAERAQYYRQLVDTLNARVAVLQWRIAEMVQRDTAAAGLLQSYKAEVANLIQQRDLAAANVKKQNKFYRRQKRKTVFVAIAGPAVTSAAILYLKK